LSPEIYEPVDVFIDRSGEWYVKGYPLAPEQVARRVDVIFNALHGTYGEDGEIQRLLDNLNVPYTGSHAIASALAMHKLRAKEAFKSFGLNIAPHTVFDTLKNTTEDLLEIFRTFPNPSVVKPMMSGSSLGVSVARTYPELVEAVENATQYSPKVLIEARISGKEATCGVIENFRVDELYSLPPVEIIPPKEKFFFDYDSKYGTNTEERCPGRFSAKEIQDIKEVARRAHRAVGASQYSRTDCIVTSRGVFVLEINTLPGLTQTSLIPKALEAVGIPMTHFIHHVISNAINRI
jgi:D-alanine-D-alanine ligase